jgi:hypothetical protein
MSLPGEIGVAVICRCPACGYNIARQLLSDRQPLATVGWPSTAENAKAMRHLPLDFVQCADCGHIYNQSFDYAEVPYSEQPYLMFNSGANWAEFIESVRDTIASNLPENPTVIEIGHGDGSFIASLLAKVGTGRFIGFDPHGATEGGAGIEFRKDLFNPFSDYQKYLPDLIVTRHVLEHMTNPLEFLQAVSHMASVTGKGCRAYLEVPCVDRILETSRTVDLYYEHSSQFTTVSFTRMLERSGARSFSIGHGYDGEVIYGLLEWDHLEHQHNHVEHASRFRTVSSNALERIAVQLSEFLDCKKTIAVWGGTGKSAAFINRYGLDADRFPIVVDSDRDKVGTFVPGTGQEIQFRDQLKLNPVNIIIVPPQWRANDILSEIRQQGINYDSILIEHSGELIDFLADDHPYPKP